MRRALSIRTKLTVLLFIGAVLPLCVGVVFIAMHELRSMEQEAIARHKTTAALVADHEVAALAFEDHEEARLVVAALARLEDISYARVYDAQGKDIAAYRPGVTVGSAGGVEDIPERVDMFGDRFELWEPIARDGVRYGTLRVGVSLASLRARIRAQLLTHATVVAFVAAFALLIAIVLQRLISGRVMRLTQLTSNFAARGDYTLRAPPMGDDEIGQLASAANRMLEEIARRQAEIHRGKQASDFLAHATAALVESLEADAMVRRLAELAVPFLGDWCIVHTLEPDGKIRCAASAHADDVGEPLVTELAAAPPPTMESMHPVSLVMESGQPLLLADVSEHHLIQMSPGGDTRILHALGTRSVMVVPVVVRDQVLGALTFASCTPGRRYDADDMRLARELAQRAAFALDNARHFHDTQEALQMRETFLSIAAHELRTPLTALKLRLQAMARAAVRPSTTPDSGDAPPPSTPTPSSTRGDVVAGATRQVDRLGMLVNQLLEITRLAKGTLVLERQCFDLRDVIAEIEEQLEYEIERSASTFKVTLEGQLDGRWDRLRLEQVIINLLTNALKFGKGKPIYLSVKEVDGNVHLSVRDEGLGIPKDAQSRIFGPFERAVSSANYGGLGLGLYITKQIVDAHGGTLRVESELGRGATFTVELPRYADDVPDSAPEPITRVSLSSRRAS